ncbi:MAG: phosphatase PAP2 family protein [Candidatus Omnitrophota bacterium]
MQIFAVLDTNIFYFFNKTCHRAVLDSVMPIVTEFGDGAVLFIMALALLLFKQKKVKGTGILLMAGLTFSYNIGQLLKGAVMRPRPFHALADVYVPFQEPGFSFPSNHASMVFMTAFLLAGCFGKKYLFYTAAVIVAVSRLYLGVHYPSDVAVGACLGILLGYILTKTGKAAEL